MANSTKDHVRVIRQAEKLGCEVTRSQGGHWKIKCPNGARISTAVTPSDRQATRNLVRDLRRYGGIEL